MAGVMACLAWSMDAIFIRHAGPDIFINPPSSPIADGNMGILLMQTSTSTSSIAIGRFMLTRILLLAAER